MDKYEFLAGLGLPPAAIDIMKANEAGRGPAPAGSGKAPSNSASASAGNSASTLPQPMLPNCKVVHGKVPGPANHSLCATHGHVVDTSTHMIIAHSVDEYKKVAAVKTAADSAVKAANKVTAQAKQAQAVAEKKRGEDEKKQGNMKVDLSLIVNGVNGPVDGLKISVIATPDHGGHVDDQTNSVARFHGRGGGKYLAASSWLPPGGFMEFNVVSENKLYELATFKTIQFPCPPKGLLRLEATEKPKISTANTSQAINHTYSSAGGVQASIGVGGSLGDSLTWTTGGGLTDTTGVGDQLNLISGNFDVKIV